MKQIIRKKDIAVIGMSGKFPQSDNLNQFWDNLVAGKEMINFYSDDELRNAGIEEKILNNSNFVKADSRIENHGSFDYNFFGYTKHEAAIMDPQIRLLHEQTWLALEDSGYNPSSYKDKIGAYLTASDNLNWRAYAMLTQNDKVNPFFLNQISNKNFISTLISYNLNLKGPSYFIDTACSSSLVAIHMACRSLWLKECSLAVSGGARIESTDGSGYIYQEGMVNSRDGHCKAFDKDSSGTIVGEGVGVIVLKRMEDAIRDKDHIYAIIRSSAINNDGDRKVGYTAPSIKGQAECIKLAHQVADVNPNTITYIEAHGTGTKLGDPIEIEALNKAFNYNKEHSCAIGSVKTNIGHLDTTAGVAGLIKAVLALKHKKIPASLNYNSPNPEINFESGPFQVNNKLIDWKSKNNEPLRAGVSSFGIGGTNAHVILEEYVGNNEKKDDDSYHLIRYSAKSLKSLNNYQEHLKEFIKEAEDVNLSDIAYTLLKGRKQFNYNRFLVANNKQDVISAIEQHDGELLFSGKLNSKQKIVFMCTGSGSQYINMCKDLYLNESYFKTLVDIGFDLLKKETGHNFSEIIYTDKTLKDKENIINNNEYTQPIVFIYEYAIAQLLMKWGISPDVMIGHSTGEYVAACLSGVFSFESALSLVIQRAKLMSQTQKGSMISVGLSEQNIKPFLSSDVNIAAINSPESCVISGTIDAIDHLYEKLEAKNISCSKLRISLGAHSYLMDPILDRYRLELEKISFSKPKIPFISNFTGQYISDEVCTPSYWINHLRSTVRFSEGLTRLLQNPSSIFIEIGPSNALTTMFQQHSDMNTNKNIALNVIRHPRQEINDQKHLLQKIGELWLNGMDINWDSFYQEKLPNKISVPGYVFTETKLPSRINVFKSLESQFQGNTNAIEDLIKNQEDIDNENEEELEFNDRSELLVKYVAPESETEQTLVYIWQDFFNMDRIGVLDDFFKLGGNSLKGVTMLKLIMKTFSVQINIRDFYKKANIKKLAAEIDLAIKIQKMSEDKKSLNVVKI